MPFVTTVALAHTPRFLERYRLAVAGCPQSSAIKFHVAWVTTVALQTRLRATFTPVLPYGLPPQTSLGEPE